MFAPCSKSFTPEAAPAAAEAPEKVEICHAAGPGYASNEVSSSSILNGQGHSGHTGDIIPPFEGFAGLNWDATGQAVYAAGCDAAAVGPNPDPNANAKVTLCHANNGSKEYSLITVSINSVIKGTGHGGHGDDIIPPFAYDGGTYAGQNWTAGRAPLTSRADCVTGTDTGNNGGTTPGGTTPTDVSNAGDTRTAGTVSDSSDAGWLPSTGGPAFWLLLLGALAVIGGAVALRLRNARSATS